MLHGRHRRRAASLRRPQRGGAGQPTRARPARARLASAAGALFVPARRRQLIRCFAGGLDDATCGMVAWACRGDRAGMRGPAAANGYCGPDPTGATACPVTTNGTLAGSISSSSEQDYYVFYVAHQTDLQLTVNDVEDAQCSTPTAAYACGGVGVRSVHSTGHHLGGTLVSFARQRHRSAPIDDEDDRTRYLLRGGLRLPRLARLADGPISAGRGRQPRRAVASRLHRPTRCGRR